MLKRHPDGYRGTREWSGQKHGAEVHVAIVMVHHSWSFSLRIDERGHLGPDTFLTPDDATVAAFKKLASLLAERQGANTP